MKKTLIILVLIILLTTSLFFTEKITHLFFEEEIFEEEIKEIDMSELLYIKVIDGIAYDWRTGTDELLTGRLIEKNDNGKLHSISTYKNGRLDGLTEYYNDEGQVIRRFKFKNGKPISAELFDKNGELIENWENKN